MKKEKQEDKTALAERLKPVLDRLWKETQKSAVSLKAKRGETTVFNSKLGGVPYLPQGFAYPCNAKGGKPLKLLAQLNFAELPVLEGFPDQGILQFYIAYQEDDDVFGLDFNNAISQKGFRVIYHKDIVSDEGQLQTPPQMEECEDIYFPFSGVFKLTGEKKERQMSTEDFRFEKRFMKLYHEYVSKESKQLFDLPEEELDYVFDKIDATGHWMGGYPSFAQADPREYKKDFEDYSVMLIQIDTDGDGDNEIIWGDCGVANFFITPEQLAARDFSKVLFNWDCC